MVCRQLVKCRRFGCWGRAVIALYRFALYTAGEVQAREHIGDHIGFSALMLDTESTLGESKYKLLNSDRRGLASS